MNKAEIPVAQRAVLSILLDDHREVRNLFTSFVQATNAINRERIAREACEKLTSHAQLEERPRQPLNALEVSPVRTTTPPTGLGS